jgi:hypothetical protein
MAFFETGEFFLLQIFRELTGTSVKKNLKGDLNVPDNRMVARQMNPLALVVFGDPK